METTTWVSLYYFSSLDVADSAIDNLPPKLQKCTKVKQDNFNIFSPYLTVNYVAVIGAALSITSICMSLARILFGWPMNVQYDFVTSFS
jgi:hypothetical protein